MHPAVSAFSGIKDRKNIPRSYMQPIKDIPAPTGKTDVVARRSTYIALGKYIRLIDPTLWSIAPCKAFSNRPCIDKEDNKGPGCPPVR